MPGNSIFDSTSFGSLTTQEQKTAVRALFYQSYHSGRTGAINDLDINELFKSRKLIPISFEYYSNRLTEIDPVTFSLLKPAVRKAREEELLFAFYIISSQYKLNADLGLDAAESRHKDLQEYSDKLRHCADLLYKLQPHLEAPTPAGIHAQHVDNKGHLAYFGVTIIPTIIRDGIDAIASGKPDAVKEWQSEGITVQAKDGRNTINAPRLYWVWTNGGLQTWISLLSDYFSRRQQALNALVTVSPVGGFLSFGLYLTNSTIELLMVAKHTIKCSLWMNERELALQANSWERFKAHVDLRKFSILNDFVWGLGNMACFFWLTGTGVLGYYGNVATAGLLLMDVVVSGFVYLEEETQHKATQKRYKDDIEKLDAQLSQENTTDAEKEKLSEQLKTLRKAQIRSEFEWKHKTYRLIKDMAYAIGLTLAFAMMCCFLLPPTVALAPLTSLILSVSGTAMCFVFSLINDSVGNYLYVVKSEASAQLAKNEIDDVEKGLLKKFAEERDPDVKKLLYLEMSQLRGELDYQTELAHFQTIEFIHGLVLRLLVPPLVFSSLIFLPLSAGVPILAAVGLALLCGFDKFYMEAKPKKGEFPEQFDETAYLAFEAKASRTIDDLPRFFTKKTLPPPADDPEASPAPAQ